MQHLGRWAVEYAEHPSPNIDDRILALGTTTSIQSNQTKLDRGLLELERVETLDINGSLPKEGRSAERFGGKRSTFGAVAVDDEHGLCNRFNRDGLAGTTA